MGTTADKLNYIIATKEAIRKTIEAKGVYLPEDAPFRSYADAIARISSNDEFIAKDAKAVNFMADDGRIIHSYTAEEVAALSAEPAFMPREGLLFKGWDYNLVEVKDYVQKYGYLNIGSNYVQNGRLTKLYISITSEAELSLYYLKVRLFRSGGSVSDYGINVDWGDGTGIESSQQAAYMHHNYAELGDYVITLMPWDGYTLELGYFPLIGKAILKKIEIGERTVWYSQSSYFLKGYGKLEYVSFLPGTTSIPGRFLQNSSLKSVSIPDGVTIINDLAFEKCTAVECISFPRSLRHIGDNQFSDNTVLETLSFPPGLQRLGGFTQCTALKNITIPESENLVIYGAFGGCSSLKTMVFPTGTISILGTSFGSCTSLEYVVFPDTLTKLEGFYGCTAMKVMDFRAATRVPTLNTDFYQLPNDCKVVVPDALYDSWRTDSNWRTSYAGGKFVKASEYTE